MKLGTTLRFVITLTAVAVIGYFLFTLGRAPATAQSPAGSDDSLFQPEATTPTEFPLPNPGPSPGPGPFGITRGPDGAMWFTERNAGKIGRIARDGSITEFALPSSTSEPNDIVYNGQDGNFWFTERAGNKIGRISITGIIT